MKNNFNLTTDESAIKMLCSNRDELTGKNLTMMCNIYRKKGMNILQLGISGNIIIDAQNVLITIPKLN